MNIFYIANVRIPTYRAHGVQIAKMCEEFARLGNVVTLVVPLKRHTIDASPDPFEVYGLERIFTIGHIPALDLLGTTRRFGRVFFWIDLVSFLLGLWIRRGEVRNSVVYVRDPLLAIPFIGKGNTIVMEVHEVPERKRIFLHLLKKANKVVVLTTPAKEDLISYGISENSILVAADGVDVKQFTPTESKHVARTRLGLPVDMPIVFYIGRLDGWKGVDTLLKASLLFDASVKLAIIGGDADEIAKLSAQYPNVYFLGNRPYAELKNNQQAADVLVLPNTARHITSARYTSPLKLFAYMTSGVPIIASDLPSLRDVLDESVAMLVAPDDAQALAYGIQSTLANKEQGMVRARAARERVQEYSWEQRAKMILQRIVE